MGQLRCYAEGKPGSWEAYCLDLDIAVQGNSFQEVFQGLNDAVEDYLDYVMTLPEEEQRELLDRSAPLSLQLKFLKYAVSATLRLAKSSQKQRAEFVLPRAA